MSVAIEFQALDVALQDPPAVDSVGARVEAASADEPDRLLCLQRLGLLDTPAVESFDTVVRLVAAALNVPIALIALVDAERVWFKSRVGLDLPEIPRAQSFCSHAASLRQALRVADALEDGRFAASPLVAGPTQIRAYLGIPLYTRDRQPVATLCVMDVEPRAFTASELALLGEYAKVVEEFLSGKELAARSDSVLQYALEREKLFRETFEQAAVGMVHTALSGAILRINQRACAMLGYGAAELRGLTFLNITHAEDLPENVAVFKRALSGEVDSYRLEQRLLCKDQHYRWALLRVSIKRTAARQPDYAIVVFEDISLHKQAEAELLQARDGLQVKVDQQAKQLAEHQDSLQLQMRQSLDAAAALREAQSALQASNAKLAAESATDALTGLPNRRSFSRRSEQAASGLRLARKIYGLILLDLDNFKQINEEYGHETGDEVLRSVGRLLASQLRNSSDMAARLGGEEFAVLCFGDINEQSLHDVAERIRAQINKESLPTSRGLLRYTASFGLALTLLDDPDWKTVYGRADAALYEAKAAGKDRTSFGRSYSKVATARLKALTLAPPSE